MTFIGFAHTFATWFSLNVNIYVIYDTMTYRVCTLS